MSVIETLKERISARLTEMGLSAREASLAATGQPAAIRNILSKNAMPRIDRLDALAEVLETTSDWLLGREDTIAPTIADEAAINPDRFRRLPKTLPVYGSALGADLEFPDGGGVKVSVEQTEVHMATPLDYMLRPIGVTGRPDLYVITVSGHSMEPRFKSGQRVLADPRRAPGIGDDVIVQLRDRTFDGEEIRHVLIKELVRRRPGVVVLRQYNPDIEFDVPNEQVGMIHRVMPWEEALGF